jgi:hypothetical protein
MATYKLPSGQKLATFKIDGNDWESFKALCEAQDSNASRTLIRFIGLAVANGKIDESFIAKPQQSSSSQNIDNDIDSLEARLMDSIDSLEARLMAAIAGK